MWSSIVAGSPCTTRARAIRTGAPIDIEVDGGITISNVDQVLQAGANVIVSGTSIFSGNITQNIVEFKKKFQQYNL